MTITKITDTTLEYIDLNFSPGHITFDQGSFPTFYYSEFERGDLPNAVETPDSYTYYDPINNRSDLQFWSDYNTSYYPMPWYFSDGENVTFQQDESGNFLVLKGESGETWIDLEVIATGVTVSARTEFTAYNDYWDVEWLSEYENYDEWNYVEEVLGLDPQTVSDSEWDDYQYDFWLAAYDIAVGFGYEETFSEEIFFELSSDLSADLDDIMSSVANAGGDVLGNDEGNSVMFDGDVYDDYTLALLHNDGVDVSTAKATYALGLGNDSYGINLAYDGTSVDLTIDDMGGDNDSLKLEGGETIDVDWVQNPETGEFDLVFTIQSRGGETSVVTVSGQGSDADSQIETFDLGSFGTFTAAELLEAFPLPFKEVTVEDTENEFDWAYYTEVTDDEGTLISRDYVYDDGREETVVYDNGVPTTSTVTDPDDANNWDSTTYTYDENGQVIEKVHLLDDGRSAATTFVDGVRTEQEVTDTKDAHAWEMFRTTYDENGQKAEIFREWDDGRTSTLTFEDGIRSEFKTTDHDDAHNWQSKHVVYDEDGNTVEQTYTLDNGREASTKFDAGQRTEQVVIDSDNSHAWDVMRTTYDENGQKAEIFREWDDGRTSTLTFENGIRSEFVTTDHDDAHDWESSRTLYDENGKPTSMTRDYDDGRSQVVTYENGQRSEDVMTDVDNAYDWLTITKVYDEHGDLETYNVVEDDAAEEDLLLI